MSGAGDSREAGPGVRSRRHRRVKSQRLRKGAHGLQYRPARAGASTQVVKVGHPHGWTEQGVTALPTACMMTAMSTVLPAGMLLRHADVGALPRATFARMRISSAVTAWLPSQSPRQKGDSHALVCWLQTKPGKNDIPKCDAQLVWKSRPFCVVAHPGPKKAQHPGTSASSVGVAVGVVKQ